MKAIKLTRAEANRTVSAINKAIAAGHGTDQSGGRKTARSVAAEAMGVTIRVVAHRLTNIKAHYPDIYKQMKAPPKRDSKIADIPKLEARVDLDRARDEMKRAQIGQREAHAEIARLQDRLRALEWASGSSAEPASWTLPDRRRARGEHMPYLLTSDFQIGEVIRREETDNAHGYNASIFVARYRKLITGVIDLSEEHRRGGWKFPGIIYARGGDTISGGIHEDLSETDELTPIESVELAFREEAAGIKHLLDAFGRVDVKDNGGGNHDRVTHKPRSKRANALSYDRLVGFMLRREFRAEPRVTFQTTESPDVFFPIYETNVLLTHGDKIGSRGGQGYIGPAATIMRGAQKVIMEQQALGRRVDRVDCGHFHTEFYGGYVLANGCLPGYSEYAKMNRLRPTQPSQWLVFHHPKYGAVDFASMVLEEPIARIASRYQSKPMARAA
ncbi:MAG: hypothetical protein KGL39_38095 [Patescibacteria group bacterium]|nr:hypothetical protein [Patescibacteria group bacterium]